MPLLSSISHPLAEPEVQSNADAVGATDIDSGDGEDGEDSEADSRGDDEEGQAQGAVHHAATLNEHIHSQRNARNGSTDDDGNGEHAQSLFLPY
jgi:hypothetical protein